MKKKYILTIFLLLFFISYFSTFCLGKENELLPHFYIPRKIVFSDVDLKTLIDLSVLVEGEPRTAFFFNQEGLFEQIKNSVDEIFLKGVADEDIEEKLPQVVVESSFSQCKQGILDGYMLLLALRKEEKEKGRTKDNYQLFDKCLLFASKRILEMKDCKKLNERIDNYEENMNCSLIQLEKLENNEKQKYFSFWMKAGETLFDHQILVENMQRMDSGDKERMRYILRQLQGKLDKLKRSFVFSNFSYHFDAPKEGEYEIYVRKALSENSPEFELETFKMKWLYIANEQFKKGINYYSVPNYDYDVNLIDNSLRVIDYSPNTVYKVSFEYRADEGNQYFTINEGKQGRLLTVYLPKTQEKRKYETFFRSSTGVSKAFFTFSVQELYDLKIEKVEIPELIARNISHENNVKEFPKIDFAKINPTRYRLKIVGIKFPFFLVFSENYHSGWKIFLSNNSSNNKWENDGFWGLLGGTARKLSLLFPKEGDFKIEKGYFDEQIKEGTQSMSFLNSSIFNTWGSEALSDDSHLLVNNYTNSWYILPEKIMNKEEIELIIEFKPQRLLYLGLFLSLIGVVLITVFVTIRTRKGKARLILEKLV